MILEKRLARIKKCDKYFMSSLIYYIEHAIRETEFNVGVANIK